MHPIFNNSKSQCICLVCNWWIFTRVLTTCVVLPKGAFLWYWQQYLLFKMEESYISGAKAPKKGCFYNATPLPPSTGTNGSVLKPTEGFFFFFFKNAVTVLTAINTVFITPCSTSRLQRWPVKGQSSRAKGRERERKRKQMGGSCSSAL